MDPRFIKVLTDVLNENKHELLHVLHPVLEILEKKAGEISKETQKKVQDYFAEASSTSKSQAETKKLFDTLSTATWSSADQKRFHDIMEQLVNKK
jgi:hypothetical protein